MRKLALLLILALVALPALGEPSSAQVARHPPSFQGQPLIEGYRLMPLPSAIVYYRILEAAADMASKFNVTSIRVTTALCGQAPTNTGRGLVYYAKLEGTTNNSARIVYSTGGVVPVSQPLRLESVEGSPGPGMPALEAVASVMANAADIILARGYEIGANETIASAIGLNASSILQIVNASLRANSVRVTIPFNVLEYPSPSGESETIILKLPCQIAIFLGMDIHSITQVILGSLVEVNVESLPALVVGGLLASPTNASINGSEARLLRVPIINDDLLAPGALGALENAFSIISWGPGENGSAPPSNISFRAIVNIVENGTEDEALRAIEIARNMSEKGLINQSALEELRDLFMKRFGYDPLAPSQGGGGQGGGGAAGGGSAGGSVELDLDNLLESLQNIASGGGEARAIGGVRPAIPGTGIRLPGSEKAARAAVAASLVIVLGLLVSARSDIEFTLRSLAARPPGGLTGSELARWCYAAALRLLEMRGLPKEPWETPREYLERVRPVLGPLARYLEELTRAYEQAAYRGEEPPRGASLRPCRRLAAALRNPLRRLGKTDEAPVVPGLEEPSG